MGPAPILGFVLELVGHEVIAGLAKMEFSAGVIPFLVPFFLVPVGVGGFLAELLVIWSFNREAGFRKCLLAFGSANFVSMVMGLVMFGFVLNLDFGPNARLFPPWVMWLLALLLTVVVEVFLYGSFLKRFLWPVALANVACYVVLALGVLRSDS
jgi:hypothetical protein